MALATDNLPARRPRAWPQLLPARRHQRGAGRLLGVVRRSETATPGATDTVSAASVGSLIERAPRNSRPFIAKIDIEGFESELFSQNTDWVRLFSIIVIELHDWLLPGRVRRTIAFAQLLASHGTSSSSAKNVVSISNTSSTDQPRLGKMQNSLHPDQPNLPGFSQLNQSGSHRPNLRRFSTSSRCRVLPPLTTHSAAAG